HERVENRTLAVLRIEGGRQQDVPPGRFSRALRWGEGIAGVMRCKEALQTVTTGHDAKLHRKPLAGCAKPLQSRFKAAWPSSSTPWASPGPDTLKSRTGRTARCFESPSGCACAPPARRATPPPPTSSAPTARRHAARRPPAPTSAPA